MESGGSDEEESACNVGDLSSIPGSGRSPGEGNGNPLQYSCLKNPMARGAIAGYSPWGRKELDMTEHACKGKGKVISNSPFEEQFNSLQQNVKCLNQMAQWPENLPASAGDSGDMDSIPGLGGGNGSPLQYSCLGNPMDRGAWRAPVHGVAKVRHD